MPLLSDEQLRFLEGPNSIIVGTQNGKLVPTCTRGLALRCEGGERLTVWLPHSVARRALEDLAGEPRVAISVNRPSTHETWQLKGRCLEIRTAPDDQRAQVARLFQAFIEECSLVGTPRRLLDRIVQWPAAELTIEPAEIFQQTPGPGAGEQIGKATGKS